MKLEKNQINYYLNLQPKLGNVENIARGVWWIRMPLPMPLDHINLWLLDEEDGFTIIDTGVCSEKAKIVWRSVLKKVVKDKPVKRLIVTHCHPDHVGLAAWLTSSLKIPLYMPLTEWLYARMLALDNGPNYMAAFAELFQSTGCPKDLIDEIRNFRNDILNGDIKKLNEITNWSDFYSTSMCRDLCFHSHEKCYSLIEIKKMLKESNLEFLGFTISKDIKDKYQRDNKDIDSLKDLELWDKFEKLNTNSFREMYQFWARKSIK